VGEGGGREGVGAERGGGKADFSGFIAAIWTILNHVRDL
jgi:hypothetical protein